MIASALCSVNAFAQYAMPDSIKIPVQQVAHSIIGREYKLFKFRKYVISEIWA